MSVTLTVGTSGRQYSTWASAIALGIPSNISSTGSNTPYILEAYNDSEFYSTSGALVSLTGITTDAVNTITLTAAPGQSFVDNASAQTNALKYNQANGVGLRVNCSYSSLMYTNVPNINISRLQLYLQGYGGGAICLQTDDHNYVSQCILQETNGNPSGDAVYFPGYASTIENSLIYSGAAGLRGITAAYDSLEICNCTIVAPSNIGNTNYGVAGLSETWKIYNTAVFGFGTNFYTGSGTYSGSNNASDQAIGFGTGNQPSLSYSSQFQGVTSSAPDFRLKTGSALVNAGATESSIITSATDIVGTSRPQGSAWDIGAWELKGASGAVLSTTPSGVANVSAALATSIPLTATLAAISSMSGALTTAIRLSVNTVGATLCASLSTAIQLTANVTTSATISASLTY